MNSPDPALSCDHVVCARRCRRWSRGSARCAPPSPCHPGLFPLKNLQNCHFLNVVSVPAQVLARYTGDAMQPQWSDRQTTISHQSGTQLLLALFRLRVSSSHNSWSSRLFRIIILPDGQPASPLLLPGYFFHREGLFSAGDHSSLRHRRLWEYQPLIMPTHPPAQTKFAKICEKEHLYALGSEVRCDRILQRCS